jgi:glycosyltransferase involved in cell wall biosynthesis
MRFLTALPVFNEVAHVSGVLDEVLRYSEDVLVVDDGSSDGTSDLLSQRRDISVIRHAQNRGYGAALATSFEAAIERGYDVLVTIDCDGQHEPKRIPLFADACADVDIVSGSRYLHRFRGDSSPPEQRRRINQIITREINESLGLELTDAFCGFKAYRIDALRQLRIEEPGYAMPLELWVQAAELGLKIVEMPVPLIYLDEKRSFGGALDDSATRLAHYREVITRSLAKVRARKAERLARHADEKNWCGTRCS